MKPFYLTIKRLIDFLGSLLGIVIISPFLIVVAFCIKISSKGPVFFKQERLGKNGKVFKIIKFRTMVIGAEKMGTGLFVKTDEDNRITKIGRLLRSTSLDELPQLFNVLAGDMSLVGPRPPVPHHPYKYKDYSNYQKKRFAVKPGMTGLTQVTVRNSVSWEDRIPIDVKYVENFNLWLDVQILFKTILKIFKKESIYTHNNSSEKKGSEIN